MDDDGETWHGLKTADASSHLILQFESFFLCNVMFWNCFEWQVDADPQKL